MMTESVNRDSVSSDAGRRPAVFVDRDGVLNEVVEDPVTGLPESPLSEVQVRVYPWSAAAIRTLQQAGFAVVCVSNQPAAAKGRISVEQVWSVHRVVTRDLAQLGAVLDGEYLCLHHPQGVVPGLAGSCQCRKPNPGSLLAAARDLQLELSQSWMVGDTDSDVAAGRAANVRTVLVTTDGTAHKRRGDVVPDFTVATLDEAAALIVEESLRLTGSS